MDVSDSALAYILSGCIFYIFGIKWCYEYAKYWVTLINPHEEQDAAKFVRVTRSCTRLMRRHPLEGTLKLIATALGLASTLTGGLPNGEGVSPRVVHATIYLFFAFSGLVDVLTFYFPNTVSDGLAKMALAQSFFIEGFLFVWAGSWSAPAICTILAAIVWTTSFSIILELVWPEMKLLRGASTLLHGGWLGHMVRTYQAESVLTDRIALAFSWHVAAAFAVTLCVVGITRSCAPRVATDEPPDIPIYDYCHEPVERV